MLSLATWIFPACSVAISSRTGAIILHGPHHSAQKSTSTGVSAALTCSSNVASLRAVIPSLMRPSSLWRRRCGGPNVVATPQHQRAFPPGRSRGGVGFEPALGVDGGHAPRTRGGDRLAVDVVLHVPTGEHAVHVGA